MDEHPQIRMLSEFVRATIDVETNTVEVECVFLFENAGSETVVRMGFPEESWGTSKDVSFLDFYSYVDGAETEATRELGERVDRYHVKHWWVKEVHFSAGQTRVVRNSYLAEAGWISTGERAFTFILWSGASWAGKIGVAEIVIDFEGPEGGVEPLFPHPEPTAASPNELRWFYRDFTPGQSGYPHAISIAWSPAQGSRP
ncbi:hypothetical protein H8E07_17220 [bacterium]|nr:hypothetical protein [bacterium]